MFLAINTLCFILPDSHRLCNNKKPNWRIIHKFWTNCLANMQQTTQNFWNSIFGSKSISMANIPNIIRNTICSWDLTSIFSDRDWDFPSCRFYIANSFLSERIRQSLLFYESVNHASMCTYWSSWISLMGRVPKIIPAVPSDWSIPTSNSTSVLLMLWANTTANKRWRKYGTKSHFSRSEQKSGCQHWPIHKLLMYTVNSTMPLFNPPKNIWYFKWFILHHLST